MTQADVIAIFRRFDAESIRYYIVGGLAVVAHGYVRMTADVDIEKLLRLQEDDDE